ncbi:uncharacterized protein LOC113509263 [Galleria mellonella]|uniref:Uncharacterized protein LOC113509263 n=1 Tax=Galleria mellonella TaxID=7137 RepID=A0ABM3MSH0_GALME|nr:uncharacterized protein LOC113509263 [Galleria mellonella]
MAFATWKCLFVLLSVSYARSDDIDVELSTGIMLKILRAVANQTQSDTLNLPANATSIRENITDTFSCENRTYGYYADVDNDCQIFHVCLPSQAPSGRNVTYRWSFICPNETIFNQEVLVCTRPREAIPCEDAPMYYDINMEFGKVSNDTKEKETNENESNNNKETATNSNKRNKNQKRKQNLIDNRNQNFITEEVLKEFVDEELKREEDEIIELEKELENNPDVMPVIIDTNEYKPQINPVKDDFATSDEENDLNSRLAAERSLKWNERKIRRGASRFKANL